MRCPACQTDNPTSLTVCQSCQAALPSPRKRSKRPVATEADSPRTDEYNRQVKRIFKLCLISMVPFLGLVLGPVGLIQSWRLLTRGRSDPAFEAERAAQILLMLGTITSISNWLGLGLILLGVFL